MAKKPTRTRRGRGSRSAKDDAILSDVPRTQGLPVSPVPETVRQTCLLLRLLDCKSIGAARRTVSNHPELQGAEALRLLDELLLVARAEGEPVHALVAWQTFLRSPRLAITVRLPTARVMFPALEHLLDASCAALEAETRYTRFHRTVDLDRGVTLWRKTLAAPLFEQMPTRWRLDALNAAGNAYMERHAIRSTPADLAAAEQSYRKAIQQAPERWPDLHRYLHNLGRCMHAMYRAGTGDPTYLDSAIAYGSQAVELARANSPNLPRYLAALGVNLGFRYDVTGVIADLEREIALEEEAVRRLPADAPEIATHLNHLGSAWRKHHLRTRQLSDLERAVELGAEAVRRSPTDHPDVLAARLTNLGNTLLDLFAVAQRPEHLKGAVRALRRAVRLTKPGSSSLPARLNNLGNGLRARYDGTEAPRDLDEVITCYEEAIRLTPRNAPELTSRLYNLGNALRVRWERRRRPKDLQRAHHKYRQAAALGAQTAPEWALAAARNWGMSAAARDDWKQAANAFGVALTVLDRLFRTQTVRRDKEAWLREAPTLAVESAYAQAKIGDTRASVTTLERGRARLLVKVLEREGADLERLVTAGYSPLVEGYQRASERLAAFGRDAQAATAESLQKTLAEHDEAVTAIRAVPGWERFLEPSTYADAEEAAEVPLVYAAAAARGGIALIVGQVVGQPLAVWLPDLTEAALRRHVVEYFGAYSERAKHRASWFRALDHTTAWLWSALTGRVLEAVPAARELTLVPAGLLGLLPIHASCTAAIGSEDHGRWLLDHVTVGYAPNARAINAARETARIQPSEILAVGDPEPVSSDPLPFAQLEVVLATRRFSDTRPLTARDASRGNVLPELMRRRVAHFACHAVADLRQPLDSSLILAGDEPLSVRDVLNLRHPGLRLVVLSACETGLPGADLPDEVVSLPTSFIQAGAAGVVASLWPVSEVTTTLLMDRFYALWRDEAQAPRVALRGAQQWLRDLNGAEFADALRRWREAADRSGRLPYALISAAWRQAAAVAPDSRPFSHPNYWAAFAYYGL